MKQRNTGFWIVFGLITFWVMGTKSTLAQVNGNAFLCNTDFEDSMVVSPGSYVIINQNAVPCWKTTATDQMIEVWGAGFNGVQPHSGSQFIELNANMVSTIYQEFTPVPASTAIISFAHRGRSGTDVMAVEIGPVGGPYTPLGTFSAGNTAWVIHTVNYTFLAGISGQYALRFNSVSSAGGSISIGNFLDDISITLAIPTMSVTSIAPNCPGSANGSIQASTSGGTPPYQYQWSNGFTGGASQTGLGSGVYIVTVSDMNGLTATDTVNLPAIPVLAVSTQISHPTCHGSSDGGILNTISGGTSPYALNWNGTGYTNTQLNQLPAGNYPYTVTDANGCTLTGSATLIEPAPLTVSNLVSNPVCHGFSNGSATASVSGGTAPYSVHWTSLGVNSPQITGRVAGNYPYTVTDAHGCTTSGSAILSQPPPVVVSAIAIPGKICQGDQVQLTATGGLQYTWSQGSTASGITVSPALTRTYTVTASDASGCTGQASVQVQVNPLPGVVLSNDTLCRGESYSPAYSAAITTGSIVSYAWDFGDQSTSAVNNPQHRFLAAGDYTVQCTATSDQQCSATVQALVRVHETPVASFTAAPAAGCAPVVASIVNTSTSFQGRIASAVWTSAGALDLGGGQFSYDTPGSHDLHLVVTTEFGCSDDTLIRSIATVYPRPVAGFDFYLDELSETTTSLVLSDRSENATAWHWDFGDGKESSDPSPMHLYRTSGIHTVRQVVDNGYGCPDTLVKNIVVGPASSLWAPNAFSPNGDGLNEVFTAYGTRIASFSMDIFDRNGERIFSTTDIESGWDGTVFGEPAQEDVYIYAITYSNINRSEKQLTGRVSLVR